MGAFWVSIVDHDTGKTLELALYKNTHNKTIVILSGYSIDDAVIQNRLSPIVQVGLERGYDFVILCVGAGSLSIESGRVKYVRVQHRIAKASNLFIRAISECILAIKLIRVSFRLEKAVTFITIPSMFCLFLARRDASLMVLDIRDLTWDYLAGSKIKRISRFLLGHAAQKKIRQFDLVTCTNMWEKRHLQKNVDGICNKTLLLSNGISEESFGRLSQIHLKNKSQRLKILYVGNVGIAQNLAVLIDSAKSLGCMDFWVVGDGVQRQSLQDRVQSENIENVFFYGKRNSHDVTNFYKKCDILYAQVSPNYHTAVPSKLYEYLVIGRPLIFGGSGAAKEFLNEFNCVTTIPPDDVRQLVLALKSVGEEMVSAEDIELNRKKIREKFLRGRNAVRLYDELSKLCLASLLTMFLTVPMYSI